MLHTMVYICIGVLGFYKGLSAPLVAQGIQKASMFFTYGIVTRGILSYTQHQQLTQYELVLSGGVAGGCTALVASPIELIRNNLQVQYSRNISQSRFTSPIHCAQQIIQLNGILGLWNGVLPMILRDVPGMDIHVLINVYD